MGPVLVNIIKYARLIIQLGPIIYEGIKWGKRIYQEIKKKDKPTASRAVLMAESGKRGARYSGREVKRVLTKKPLQK